jgi:hypothetical protein
MSPLSPVISNEATLSRASVGFNASHSMAAILFGIICGFLEVARLFQSPILLNVGMAIARASDR